MQVNILEAKNRLSELIKSARSGEEVVIANRGEPVVRLVPIEVTGSVPGSGRDIVEWLDQHPLPAHARRASTDIDAGIEAERAGWD